MGAETPFMYWYYPFHKGYSRDWKIPPYDPERAKKLLAEAGHAGGFEMRVNPMVFTYALDGHDMMEAVALDWEKIGIKVRRVPEAFANFLPKNRARKTGQDPLGLRLAALRRAGPRLAAHASGPRAPSTCSAKGPTTRTSRRSARDGRRQAGQADPRPRSETLRDYTASCSG